MPEIGKTGNTVAKEDVLRLHVAVNDCVRMRVLECRPDALRDHRDIRQRQLPVPLEPVAQRAAVHVGQHTVQRGAGDARVENLREVRMGELLGDPDLTEEAFGTYRLW